MSIRTPAVEEPGPADRSRHELGHFLRARRERTTPADVGLPGSLRRRTPGLRREEVAVLAGVSTTWYIYLEQGRDIHPSGQVLDAIAGALHLSQIERRHLRSLASAAEDSPLDQQDHEDESVSAEVAAVVQSVLPSPAYVVGAAADLLTYNAAAEEVFPAVADGGGRANLARWVFLDPHAREVLVDWEPVAQTLLARLRTQAGLHPGDGRFAALVAELRAGSAEADTWWSRYDIATHHAGSKRLRHPRLGEITVRYAALTVTDSPDQQLIVYQQFEPHRSDKDGARDHRDLEGHR